MSTLRGPILMVVSMAAFAIQDGVIKAVSVRVPVGQVALLLGIGGTLIFWLVARSRGVPLFVSSGLKGAALVRNLTEVGAGTGMIVSLALVPLSVVAAIMQAMPLTVTLGAALFLGEAVGWRRWSAIGVGFIGVLMILKPGSGGFDQLALLPLIAVCMMSARDIATKRVPTSISSLQLSGWGFIAIIPGGVLLLVLRNELPVVPSLADTGLLLANIAVGIVGYSLMVAATRAGDLAVTMPFRYSRLVFATALGIIVFGERPGPLALAGAGLIVAAGLYSFVREIRLSRVRTV